MNSWEPSRRLLKFAALAFVILWDAPRVEAQSPYNRVRVGADDWSVRGGYAWGPGFAGHPSYGFFGGAYGAGFSYGNWYQRPYPTHLDYFRLRQGGAWTPAECPCLDAGQEVAPVIAAPLPN